MATRTIRLLKGSVILGTIHHLAGGKPFEVAEEIFHHLVASQSPTLQVVEVVAAEIADALVGEALQDGRQDGRQDEGDGSAAQSGTEETDTHTGEGESFEDVGEVAEVEGAPFPSPAPAASPVPSELPLASVDATVAAALVAAGWDSVEKLKTATEAELVTVKGIGISRARAILAEVGA